MTDSSWLGMFQEGPLSLDDLTPVSSTFSPQVFSPPVFSPLVHCPHQMPPNSDIEKNKNIIEGLNHYVRKPQKGKPLNRFLVDHIRVRLGFLFDTKHITDILQKWKDMRPDEFIDGLYLVQMVQSLIREAEEVRRRYNDSIRTQRDGPKLRLGRLSLSLDVRGTLSNVIDSAGTFKEEGFSEDLISSLDGDILHAKVTLDMPRDCGSGLGSSPDVSSMLEIILADTAETRCVTSKTKIYHKQNLFIEKSETLFGVGQSGSTVIKDPFHNKFWAAIVNYHLNGVLEFSANEFSIVQSYYSENQARICTVVFEFEVGCEPCLVYRVLRKPIKRRRSVSQTEKKPVPLRKVSANCLPARPASKKWVSSNDLKINFYQPGG